MEHRNVEIDGRLAVGRDHDSGCPMRGQRVGGGSETMHALVKIEADEARAEP